MSESRAVRILLLVAAVTAALISIPRSASALKVTPRCSRLIAGRCAGPLVGPLAVSGRTIVDRGQGSVPVLLQGAMFEGPGWLAGQADYDPLGFPDAGAVSTLEAWGVNFVRLTLSADAWDQQCNENYLASYPAPGYQNDVKRTVTTLTEAGIYVVLDLYTSNPDCKLAGPGISGDAPMPGQDAAQFWQQVAADFSANPLVGFEPWNEPEICATSAETAKPTGTQSACSQADLQAGWAKSLVVRTKTISYTDVGMTEMYRLIHRAAPTSLVFLDSNGWASETATFQHMPKVLARSKHLVYAMHPYDCQDKSKVGATSVAACRDEAPEACPTIAQRIVSSDTDHSTGRRLNRPVVFDEIGFPEGEQAYYAPGVVNGTAGYYPVTLVQRGLYLYNFIAEAQARGDGFAVFTFNDADTGDSWNGPYLLVRRPVAPGDAGPWHPTPDGTVLYEAGTGKQLTCQNPPPGYDTWTTPTPTPTPTPSPTTTPTPTVTPAPTAQ
ncbi:MAG TPA: cellulase family glycosylhydrolase [Mycobacteriales bacterium]|nr:cellulase family glycosylhydrolase [Mycobacteriales bacterium]